MSLKVDADLSGGLTAGAAGGKAPAAVNGLPGLPALFAALLAGQTGVTTTDGTSSAKDAPTTAAGGKKSETRAEDGGSQNASPADPNAASAIPNPVLLFIPPPALLVPSVPTAAPLVPIAPPAAPDLKTAAPDPNKLDPQKEVMDTALAPAQAAPQASSELLPQIAQTAPTESIAVPQASVPIATPQAVVPVTAPQAATSRVSVLAAAPQVNVPAAPKTIGIAPQEAPPAPQFWGEKTPQPAAAPPSVLPIPVKAAQDKATASALGTSPAPPELGIGGRSAAPLLGVKGSSSVVPSVPSQITQAVTSAALPQTSPKTTLQNSSAPANNTGRNPERKGVQEQAAQAAPTSAHTATLVSSLEETVPHPAAQDADRKKSTGFPDLPAPAQAPTVTPQAAPSAKTEGRGTAAQQVADKIVSLPIAPGRTQQVVVNLHPRDWGQVRVEVTQAPANADGTAGAVTARLTAQNPEARAALQASSGELRRALHDSGLRLDTVTVTDTVQTVTQGAAASADNGAPFRQGGDDGGQSTFAGQGGAFAGSNNAASNGAAGGGRSGFGQSGNGPQGTPEPEAAHPEHYIAAQNGVDIRA